MEALAESALQAVGGDEGVQGGFEVEGSACDGFHLIGGVVVIRGHVDMRTTPGVGFDEAHGLYDFPRAVDKVTEVVIGFEMEDGGDEFEWV